MRALMAARRAGRCRMGLLTVAIGWRMNGEREWCSRCGRMPDTPLVCSA